MSYPKDLDEYTQAELEAEIELRSKRRAAGLCDYCNRRAGTSPACKFPERHFMVTDEGTRRLIVGHLDDLDSVHMTRVLYAINALLWSKTTAQVAVLSLDACRDAYLKEVDREQK